VPFFYITRDDAFNLHSRIVKNNYSLVFDKCVLKVNEGYQGSTLEKKPWGQLAPKFLDLVASTNFFVAKKFSALRAKDFHFNSFHLTLSNYAFCYRYPYCFYRVSLSLKFRQLHGKGKIKNM